MRNNVKQLLITSVLSFLIALFAILISFFSFVNEAIKEQAIANNQLSIFVNADYDYIINNPSNEQIENFMKNESIEEVVPFYQLIFEFDIAGDKIELTMKSIDDMNSLCYTEFSKDRLVKEKDVSGNKIYLDYGFAKKYNIKLGDTIGENVMQFVVAGFYSNYNQHLAYVPNLNNIVKSKLNYSGTYIKVANEEEFKKSVVDGYKPLATLKDRESFSDDEAYQNYLDNFYNRDHSSYIVNKNLKESEETESFAIRISQLKNNYLISGIVSSTIILFGLISLSLIFIKKIKYEVVDGNKRNILVRYAISGGISLLVVVLIWLISVVGSIYSQVYFIKLSSILSYGWLSITLPIVSVIIATGVNLLIVRGYKEKQR